MDQFQQVEKAGNCCSPGRQDFVFPVASSGEVWGIGGLFRDQERDDSSELARGADVHQEERAWNKSAAAAADEVIQAMISALLFDYELISRCRTACSCDRRVVRSLCSANHLRQLLHLLKRRSEPAEHPLQYQCLYAIPLFLQNSCLDAMVTIRPLDTSEQLITVKPIETLPLDMAQIYQNGASNSTFRYKTFIQRVQLSSEGYWVDLFIFPIDMHIGMNYEYVVYGDKLTSVGPFQIKPPHKKPDQQRIVLFGDLDSQWI